MMPRGGTQGGCCHDDVIKWKHFPRYWPFARGIHRSPVNSPAQRPVTRSFDVFFDLRLNKRLSKQSWGWWFDTLSRPLWRHRNAMLCGCTASIVLNQVVLSEKSTCWITYISVAFTVKAVSIYDFVRHIKASYYRKYCIERNTIESRHDI